MTAATALAMATAGFALTGAPDWRARLLGAVLCVAAGIVVCSRWERYGRPGRVDADRGVVADRGEPRVVGAGGVR